MPVKNNLQNIYTNIEKEALVCQRSPDDIKLIAVSKKQPIEKIQQALAAGHRIFGENRVQEAQEHWSDIKPNISDLELHLIGPLQTNKVKDAVALFDVIQSLDREKLAKALAKEIIDQNAKLSCFIQVNTGQEPQKSGIEISQLKDFYIYCSEELKLNIKGLMCLPPLSEPAAIHFAFLNKCAKELDLKDLSMGMSSDFKLAIPLGATYLRIGTAVFGQRQN